MSQVSWEQMSETLAARLTRLREGDTVILEAPPYYTQLQQGPRSIHVEAASTRSLAGDARLTPEQEQRLRDQGWRPPDPPLNENWRVEEAWPLSGRTAKGLANLIVNAMRDVYGLDITQVEERAFNAFS